MINIAIMGHGVVGSGVAEVLTKHPESIANRAGDSINIKYILDLKDFPDSPLHDRFIKDFEVIISDPEVKVVAEVMGGLEPAYTFTKRCLLAGKSVVTSNKELVASKGCELLSIAKEHNVNYLFEASVGGGIPIIRPLSQCMAANEIDEIQGILNGTTNFILTKMIKENMSFEAALSEAQALGYAESDPTADVEGQDACRKVCILASLAFGKHVYPEQVYTEGITKISLSDVAFAGSAGYVIKLIGRVLRLEDGRLSATVYPALIENGTQLSTVDDVFNAVLVRGDATGDVVFYGRGAGKLPTASAVVADIIDCCKHIHARKYLFWTEGESGYIADHKDDIAVLYVRARIKSKEADKVAMSAFKNVRMINFDGAKPDEIAFITAPDVERELLEKLNALGEVLEPLSVLHIVS